MAMELFPSSVLAFATSRTPPSTEALPSLASRSTMRRPVCPVAPATRMVCGSAAPTGWARSRAASRLRRAGGGGGSTRLGASGH